MAPPVPPLPAPALPRCGDRPCGNWAVVGWEDPQWGELAGTGALPRAQPGWPCPPPFPAPVYSVRHLQEPSEERVRGWTRVFV